MIPSTTGFLTQDFELEEIPSKTYKINLNDSTVRGYTDGLEAMHQVIYAIVNTERYQYPIYSWDYGIELMDLYGEPLSFVCPELERRITEALLCDDRIQGVDNFEFDISQKGQILASFTVHTVFGDIQAEKVVNKTNV